MPEQVKQVVSPRKLAENSFKRLTGIKRSLERGEPLGVKRLAVLHNEVTKLHKSTLNKRVMGCVAALGGIYVSRFNRDSQSLDDLKMLLNYKRIDRPRVEQTLKNQAEEYIYATASLQTVFEKIDAAAREGKLFPKANKK